MIETHFDAIEISPTTRVKAYYDTDAELDWVIGDDVNIYTVRPLMRYSFDRGELNRELGYINSNVERHQEQSAMGKYLALAGYNYSFVQLQGYSQGEWAEVVVYTKEDFDLAGTAYALNEWFKGDVYTIALEELEVYTSPSGNTIERWEIIDSVGGFIFSDDYTFEKAAREHFPM